MKKNYHFRYLLTLNRTFFLIVLLSFTLKTVAFTISSAPVIVTQPYDRTICESANTYFTIKATNADSYLWQVSNDGGVNWLTATSGIYTGETTDTLRLVGAYLSAQYRCIVGGGGVQETSSVANLNFFIIDQSVVAKSTQVCREDSTTITLGSSQTGINYYLKDGSTVKGPFAGTGGALAMSTGPIYSTKTFSVLAQKSALGSALLFDGVDDYVKVDKGIAAAANFTLSVFVFPSDVNNGKILSTDQYELGITGGGIQFKSTALGTVSYNSLSKDTWSHITVTYDGATLRLYINGTEVNTAAATGTLAATTAFTIGKDNTTACCYFNGKLDEFRLRNKCLSLAEVREGMTDCIAGSESDVIAYYRFDDGAGSPFLSDLSGHGLHGVLTNSDKSAAWVLGTSACGDNLACSKIMLQTPKITVYSLVPQITSTSPGSRCEKGVVMLAATASQGNLSWFTTLTGGNAVGAGNSFTTPVLTATTSYYVSSTEQGCTSERKEIVATINALPDVSVVANAATITATANQPGATYQWLDCKREMQEVAGATANPFVASTSGSYAVSITLKGCKDTSKCVSVTVATGIEDEINSKQLLVFPNPSTGTITIRATVAGTYLLLNELGQTIQVVKLSGSNNYATTIDNLSNGMYILVGTDDRQGLTQKIIVAN